MIGFLIENRIIITYFSFKITVVAFFLFIFAESETNHISDTASSQTGLRNPAKAV